MNILHLRYAVAVAREGSVNKAAESLTIAQPNLSRSIKELENEIGITIFERTAQGMIPTVEGDEFLSYAKSIIRQIEDVEQIYKGERKKRHRFAISAPRASYISAAFTDFSKNVDNSYYELFYHETNSQSAITNILYDDYTLGIIRYAVGHSESFERMFEEKGLVAERLAEFRYVLTYNKMSPLSRLGSIHYSDLEDLTEIAHADPYVPSLSVAQAKREELPDEIRKRIFVYERASQFELLASNPYVYMWVSPIPGHTLRLLGLEQRYCEDNTKEYVDMLIYKKDYKLTKMDRDFMTQLYKARDNYLVGWNR